MLAFASVVLGIVPMLLFAALIWRIDRWETEPFPLILGAFLWGAIPSVLFSLVAGTILGIPVYPLINSFREASFKASPPPLPPTNNFPPPILR